MKTVAYFCDTTSEKVGMLFAQLVILSFEFRVALALFTKKKIKKKIRMRIEKGLAEHVTCWQNVKTWKKDRL